MKHLEEFRQVFFKSIGRLPTAEEEDNYEDETCFNEKICMTCGGDNDLVDDMYCLDCSKRQQFLHIFNESSTYSVGSYFGKHLLEKYLGYYVSEDDFILFMKNHNFKFNEKKMAFKTKINKKKSIQILGNNI